VSEAAAVGGCPTLESLDAALTTVGWAIAEAAAHEPSLGLTILRRNDGLFACFPGGAGSPGYGAHLDGDEQTCRLSSIAYCNAGWDAEADGGELHLLDDPHRCWRSVAPEADTLVVFRSRNVLHKVAPATRRRFALTAFWSIGRDTTRHYDH
jgi:predicted 2-oxoglutarate/Fe(II)-dependent dioxygenase YbiX